MVISKRTYTKGHLTGLLLSVPSSLWHPLMTHTSTGDPPTLAGRYGSVSSGGTGPFCWVLVHTSFVCALEEWSLWFPQSCGSPVIKSCWPSGSGFLGIPSPFPGSSGWKAWCGAQNLHNCGRTSLVSLFSSLWVIHSQPGYGIWFYHDCTPAMIAISLQFVFGCVVSFLGGFQCPSVAGCSTASCDFGALAGGDEHTSFYSAILNQKPTRFLFLFYF